MDGLLEQERAFFQQIRDDLVKLHDGKFVVIKGEEVLGVFKDRDQAVKFVNPCYERGKVLIRRVQKEDSIAIVTTRTMVAAC